MYKVLIIEDDPSVRDSIKEALELNHYEMISAENGLDALEVCKQTLPDLIISDIMMPYMNGYEVLHAFQSNPVTSSIPFIFLTAKSTNADVRAGMSSGADDYITKPFKVKDLLQTVEMRLKKKENFDNVVNRITKNISQYLPNELRMPLVAIMGYSDLIITQHDKINKKEMLEMLNSIKTSGNRLYKTIEKFLVNAELTLLADNKTNYKTDFSSILVTNQFISNAIKSIVNEAGRSSDVKIQVEESNIPVNAEHLMKIIQEAVDNSLKYSDNGSSILISGSVKNNNYCLDITDNGFGITAEQLKKINNPDSESKGLGIPIIKKIVQIYKGTMDLVSEKGRFTSVKLTFPLVFN